MRDKVLVVCILALFFFGGALLGYHIGKDATVVTFRGMPDNAVIHMEIDKGAEK